MTSEQRDPREAWDDDLKAAWSVVTEAAEDSPLYNGTVYCAMKELRSRVDAADPIRAILPEVVEAWKTFEEQYVHEFGEHRVKGDHLDRTFQRLSGALAPLRALTATEGGTDDGE